MNNKLGWISVLCWYLSLVVEDLADGHARVNADRLHGEHFQCPIATEPHVAETGRHVYEKPQPADRRTALDHRYQIVGLGPFQGSAQVELVGLQHEAFRWNRKTPHAVRLAHVQHDLFVDHDFIVQRQVIAVGIHLRLVERIDDDVAAQFTLDFMTG